MRCDAIGNCCIRQGIFSAVTMCGNRHRRGISLNLRNYAMDSIRILQDICRIPVHWYVTLGNVVYGHQKLRYNLKLPFSRYVCDEQVSLTTLNDCEFKCNVI
jgi:hypothetical protein